MKLHSTLVASLLACLMVLSIFASCGNAAAEAQAPEWEEGDSWAAGFSVDLGAEFAEEITEMEDALGNMSDVSVDEFDVDGEASMWLVFEVSEVTETEYVLTADMAQKLTMSADVEATGELPEEGNHSVLDMNTTEKTVTVEASIDYALVISAEATLDKESMGLKTLDVDVACSAAVDLSATNIPEIDEEDGSVSVEYQDYDVSIALDLNMGIEMTFSPYLDIFQFPFEVGDEWTVESTASISGTIDGQLDASGLPPEAVQELFDDDVLSESGITEFPIRFDEISTEEDNDDGPTLNNGTIEETSEPIGLEMECIGQANRTIPDHGTVTVYELQIDDDQVFYYSPDMKFLTSMDMGMDDIPDEMDLDMPDFFPDDMSDDMSEDMNMEFGSQDPETASNNINDIADYQSSVSEEISSGGSEDGQFSDFFLKSPYFGLIIVALAIVVVASAVFAVVKKR